MEVILQEDYPVLGYVGDKVKVKGGYARNFLIPRGIALEANTPNAKLLKHRAAQILAKKAKLKAAAQETAKQYEGLILEFVLKIGEKGKSFGAVTLKDIEVALAAKNFVVDRKQIRIAETIKAGGDYRVDIKLHSEVVAPITARVIVERTDKKAAAADKPARNRRGKGKAAEEGDTASAETVTATEETSSDNSEQ